MDKNCGSCSHLYFKDKDTDELTLSNVPYCLEYSEFLEDLGYSLDDENDCEDYL